MVMRTFCESGAPWHIAERQSLIPIQREQSHLNWVFFDSSLADWLDRQVGRTTTLPARNYSRPCA